MDISKVYVLDSKFPSEYTVSAEGDFLELIYYDYQRGFWHVPFVHHEYTEYWEKGIPIIHATNNIKFRNGAAMEVPGKYVTVFLPNSISYDNADLLQKRFQQIQNLFSEEKCHYNLVYVKEKTPFGFDYECYPPMYITGKRISFQEAISLFLKDSFGQLSKDETTMFHEFRTFDIKKMLTETSAYSFPINHNYCGVVVVNSEGERYSSTVTKNGHQETLNYLLSCMTGRDVHEENIGIVQETIEFSTAILLFREGELFAYIPERVSQNQYTELSCLADQMDNLLPESKRFCSATRVLSDGTLVDEELSFRDNIMKSYYEFVNQTSRGSVLKKIKTME